MKKLAAISLVLAMTAASLAGCGSTANTAAPAESEAAETPAATTEETTDTAADTVAADGKVYNIGICQLVQHEALDAATQGFQDALTKLLGEENVSLTCRMLPVIPQPVQRSSTSLYLLMLT